jgi:hypothetical protein
MALVFHEVPGECAAVTHISFNLAVKINMSGDKYFITGQHSLYFLTLTVVQ